MKFSVSIAMSEPSEYVPLARVLCQKTIEADAVVYAP
jgi:hypothetical protein